jgi:protein tyrosine phosphatase (PTP) superfamily phosphohydrolase (DUF442 family)
MRRRRFLVATALLACIAPLRAQPIDAPNVVVISSRLVTSGQPTAVALAGLKADGFEAVLYLAPFTVPHAVKDEAEILERQGIAFVHIPIPFGQPTAEHARAVSRALERLGDRKVLVHCEINLRASSMVFLHRATVLREDPARAYASVTAVWSPSGPWWKLIDEQLRAAGVTFEPM